MGKGEHASYTVTPQGWAKLSESEVREILTRRGDTQQAMADEFHVSRITIHRIVNGKSWRWLYDEIEADQLIGVDTPEDDDGMDMI